MLPEISWTQVLYDFIKVLIAFVLAMPVAWDREDATRIMGLRTFPLVALASSGYVLVAGSVLGYGAPEQARILQGLMTGMGFLGGGAILKEGANVKGTATAASISALASVERWLTPSSASSQTRTARSAPFARACRIRSSDRSGPTVTVKTSASSRTSASGCTESITEAFLEESENKLFEKGQDLQERGTALDQRETQSSHGS